MLLAERVEQGLEPARRRDVGGEDGGIVGGKAERALIPVALGVRQLGERGPAFLQEIVGKLDRKQVRVREVAVIVRFFLGAETSGFGLVRVPQAGFLDDRTAGLEQIDLAVRLMLDRGHDESDRIDVLGLGPGAELAAGTTDADVDVGAHRALLHIAVAASDVAQDRS